MIAFDIKTDRLIKVFSDDPDKIGLMCPSALGGAEKSLTLCHKRIANLGWQRRAFNVMLKFLNSKQSYVNPSTISSTIRFSTTSPSNQRHDHSRKESPAR
jgi:hypothetical protein